LEIPGPLYPLRDICDFAKAGKVTFSLSAANDLRKAGFTREEACECISYLSEGEYDKSHRYDQRGIQVEYDAYVTTVRRPGGAVTLYVKVRRVSPSVVDQVHCTSFHPQRPIDD
jgi:hypothetical protein